FPPVVQAAQQFARAELGELAIDALRPRDARATGKGAWRVTLAREPDDVVLEVTAGAAPEAALLTCAATHPAHPPAFTVRRVDGG
ncbi:MAG TPA: sucrase ferredoxin, partial [Candidatus Eisenbacteria bacterium]|nr:sucrase ferredoxin [Candidatus Eisenbacteria bacterium]